MRDTKLINAYAEKINKDKKQMELFKNLKKEVETGASRYIYWRSLYC